MTTVVVERFNQPSALVARAALDAAGITAHLADEHVVGLNWLYMRAIGGMRLMDPETSCHSGPGPAVRFTVDITTARGWVDDSGGREIFLRDIESQSSGATDRSTPTGPECRRLGRRSASNLAPAQRHYR